MAEVQALNVASTCRWTKQFIRTGALDYKKAGRPVSRLHESRHVTLHALRAAVLEGFKDDQDKSYPFPNMPWAHKHSPKIAQLVADLKIDTPEYAWVLLKQFFPDLTLHKASLKHPRKEPQAQDTAKRVLGELPFPINDSLSHFQMQGDKTGKVPACKYWACRDPPFHYNPDILLHQLFMDGLTVQPERSVKSMRAIGIKGHPPPPSPCKVANAKV